MASATARESRICPISLTSRPSGTRVGGDHPEHPWGPPGPGQASCAGRGGPVLPGHRRSTRPSEEEADDIPEGPRDAPARAGEAREGPVADGDLGDLDLVPDQD